MEWSDRLASHPGAVGLRASLDEALARIAARSPMRADRLRSWGVLSAVQKPEGPDADPATIDDAAAGAAAVAVVADDVAPAVNDGGEEKKK